jgi:hypothetical protein
MKKAIFSILAIAAISFSSLKADDHIPRGSIAVANDPTNQVAFGSDSTKSMDKLMKYMQDRYYGAVRQLYSQGHVIAVPNGSKVKILDFDSGENAYRVRVIGSTKDVWLIKELVSKE